MGRLIGAIVLITGLVICRAEMPAADFPRAFDEANALYEQGQFEKGATAYESMIAQGAGSPTLWFNLGNAWFKAGELGNAIAAYRQAQALSPRDPDVRFNLQLARRQAHGSEPPSTPWMERTLSALTLNEWTLLACVSFWMLFGLLAAREWRPALRRSTRTWIGLAAILLMVSGAALIGAVQLRCFEEEAVIVAEEAAVHQGPLEVSPTAFTLRDGAELKVLDQMNGWWHVRDAGGRVGWIPQTDAIRLNAR